MTGVPEVEQHVARTRIESAHRSARRKIGEVGDPAEVDDDAMHAGTEQRRVKRRHERRPLPTRGDIAAAKVRDHGDVHALGDAGSIVELERPALVGAMA